MYLACQLQSLGYAPQDSTIYSMAVCTLSTMYKTSITERETSTDCHFSSRSTLVHQMRRNPISWTWASTVQSEQPQETSSPR